MWLLVVSRSSNYWLGISPHVTLIALVDVEVYLSNATLGTGTSPYSSKDVHTGFSMGGTSMSGCFSNRTSTIGHPFFSALVTWEETPFRLPCRLLGRRTA